MVSRLTSLPQLLAAIWATLLATSWSVSGAGQTAAAERVALAPPAAAAPQTLVTIRTERTLRGDARETFVITHGCGGTTMDDRFCHLAAALCKGFPEANVLILDWSEAASARFHGLPNPWQVARNIDPVADQAADQLAKSAIDPATMTMIGESFGTCVNARIARKLGGVLRMLAFNPASDAGGYAVPDLRQCSKQSWSFHTYSAFDTSRELADGDFFLETPAGSTDWVQHVAGISWLAERVQVGDRSWLLMDWRLPPRRVGFFQARAMLDGQLVEDQVPRLPPMSGADTEGDSQ